MSSAEAAPSERQVPYAEYIYGATLAILLVEIIAGRHRGLYDRKTWYITLGCIAAAAVCRPLAALIIAYVVALALPQWQGVLAGSSVWWTFPVVFVTAEFAFYWAHRLSHESKGKRHDWFWKLHRTHHSAKFMNVGVTIRINAFWSFVVPTTWILGISTYLGMGEAAGYTIATIYMWNLITHANFRWDDAIRAHPWTGKAFRALEHIIVSPGMHHSHHGYGKNGGNFRNYAVTLALFDWMFGTLFIPQGRPWKYGIPGPNAHWAEEVLFPLFHAKTQKRDVIVSPPAP